VTVVVVVVVVVILVVMAETLRTLDLSLPRSLLIAGRWCGK
jgi:hypothetical protein